MKRDSPPPHEGDPPGLYRFDDIEVDVAGHTLVRDGQPRALEPKAFAVLLMLLARPGELLGRDELMDGVWGHRHVTPGVLTRAIAQLRAALGDDPHDPRYIQTQHSVGYRFIGSLDADEAGASAGDSTPPADEVPANAPAPDAPPPDPVPTVRGGETAAPAPAPAPPFRDRRAPVAAPVRWRGWLGGAMLLCIIALALWFWRLPPTGPPAGDAPPVASIAVLPFTNLGQDREDDYFAEGLAVEMHDALAGVEGLVVAARMSPAQAARADMDVKAIGDRLGVATVLDATVRRDGARLRINARLSDCGSGYTLWSRSYDRELTDIFATQSEIAEEVVTALLGVIPETRTQLSRRLSPTTNFAAFDAYLRGLQQLRVSAGSGNVDTAVGYFNRALAEDGDFARAQAGICRSELLRFTSLRSADAFQAARTACGRAQEMSPDSGEVHLALGDLHLAQAEYAEATTHFMRARDDPAHEPSAHVGLARVHAAQGHHEQALPYFQRALALRPGSVAIHGWLGYEQFLAGDVRGAIASYQEALRLDPGDAGMWSSLGGLHLLAGNEEDAMQAFEQSIRIRPTGAVLSNYGALKMQSGDFTEAATLFRRALELEPGDFLIWGHLGDALLAEPTTATQAREPYSQAAQMARRYLEINPDDAKALAALGWYTANLDDHAQARALVRQSEARAGMDGSIALVNAQTLSVVGSGEEVQARIALAREAGIADTMIASNAFLKPAAEGEPTGHPPAR